LQEIRLLDGGGGQHRRALGLAWRKAALADYLGAIHQAQSFDRQVLHATASAEFATERVVYSILSALDVART
jgi:hypothetical protein